MQIATEKIMLSQQDSIFFVKQQEIVYCQSDNCYTKVFLQNQKRILIVKSLTRFHKELPDQFVRVNQSYIINKAFVTRIDKKRKTIWLEGELEIPFTLSLKELLGLIVNNENTEADFEEM